MKITIKIKSKKVLGDYIALHGRVPNNELPKRLRYKIPVNQLWIRDDIWNDKIKRHFLLLHEKAELNHMINGGLTYKKAHKWGETADGFY